MKTKRVSEGRLLRLVVAVAVMLIGIGAPPAVAEETEGCAYWWGSWYLCNTWCVHDRPWDDGCFDDCDEIVPTVCGGFLVQ